MPLVMPADTDLRRRKPIDEPTIATTPPQLDDRLFDNLSVYQDVVLAGRTVRRGARDCQARWELMAPHLPRSGSVIDVGSNFGWFGWRICQERPDCVVASVEADERSAAVQREALRTHGHERICLLTSRAGSKMVRRFAQAGQRFDTVLCLSVLHWIADHRQFLTGLGQIATYLFVELPHPDESGAGVARIRQEIGAIGPYLRGCFPDRPVRCLGTTANHRRPDLPRELWMVGDAGGESVATSPGLEVSALLQLSVSWPPRTWWQGQIENLNSLTGLNEPTASSARRALLTSRGLRRSGAGGQALSLGLLRRHARAIPESELFSPTQRWHRRLRKTWGALLHGLRRLRRGGPPLP